MPSLSVVIPAYNVAPLIGETLQTVFAQTFTDLEVIVINDGSPDTEELECALEPFIDRINYIKQENRGVSAARNAGVRAARGEFVAFLDADDLWLPNYLEEQVKFIRAQDCDLVCADAEVFSESSRDERTYFETLMSDAPLNAEVTFRGLLSAKQSLITSGVVVRRDPVIKVGLFDEELRNAQDFDLWLRLARSGAALAYQRSVLLRYRSRTNSLSGDEINVHRRELRVLEKIERKYKLTAAERVEVLKLIEQRRSTLEFELGKLYLTAGEFAQAQQSFENAHRSQQNWRTRFAVSMSHLSPRLMKALYLRRLRYAHAR